MDLSDIWQIKTSQVNSLKAEFDSLPRCKRCFQKNYQFTSGALSYKGVVKIEKPIDSDGSQDPFMDLYVPHGEVECTTPNCLSFLMLFLTAKLTHGLKEIRITKNYSGKRERVLIMTKLQFFGIKQK